MNATRQSARRDILEFLRRAGDLGTTSNVIQTALRRSGQTAGDIERDLQYLAGQGKEYVKVETLEIEEMGRRMHAVILPKGIDLLEGNIPADPGVA